MRILIWAGSYPPELGGVGVVVEGLARSLAARGEAVQVVAQSADNEGTTDRKPEGVVHRLPFHQVLSSRDPARVAALTERVARIMRDFEPHVAHVHAMHPSEFFLLRTADVAPCPLVFTLHGWTPMASGRDTLRDRMLRRADWVTGCSQHVVDRAIREVPEIDGRSLTITTVAAIPEFASPRCRSTLRGFSVLGDSSSRRGSMPCFGYLPAASETSARHPADDRR